MTESCRLRLKRPSSEGQAEPSSDVVGRRQPLRAAIWAKPKPTFLQQEEPMNKDIRLTIRLTPEQYESICTRAEKAQMTPSAFVRAATMRHKVTVIDGLREFTQELKGIGRNLNHLTVLANEGHITEVNLTASMRSLSEIYDRLSALTEQEKR